MAVAPATLDAKSQAALALHRFGLGPRPGGIAAMASDPRGAVLAEVKGGGGLLRTAQLLSSDAAARAQFEFNQERKAEREAKRAEAAMQPQAGEAASNMMAQPAQASAKRGPGVPQQIYLEEAKARVDAALTADIGLTERLVWFWSNHFCVSADKGPLRALCGAYEREVIRPHVFGKFADMLLVVETHPAMLIYLDNARSIGPNSIAGQRQHKGLNENLAREILELHTLGVRTVYDQTDVTNFAKVITGWTIVPPRQQTPQAGRFVFNPRMHEPGSQTVIGKSYADHGFAQGSAVLEDIARHPATATHIARKLAIHFVADEPPQTLVDKLSRRFLDSQGDLMEVTKTLVTAPESWDAERGKLKKPSEWIIAAMRATRFVPQDIRRVINTQNLLGEPLWRPPAPKGFADDSVAWLDGMAERLDIANQLARQIGNNGQQPDEMIDDALGPLASRDTREAIKRAESRPQALALLLMAPEFQKR